MRRKKSTKRSTPRPRKNALGMRRRNKKQTRTTYSGGTVL